MSATSSSSSRVNRSSQRDQLRSGLTSAAVMSIVLGGLVLAIPGLGAVGHRLEHVSWGWVVLAGGLELASCIGYMLAFQEVFHDIPARFAMLVASAEQAFGAVLPVGGAGGIAAGGWLLSRAGLPARIIAERSGILFLLTSATNVVTLVVAGAGLAIGLFAGPRNLTLSALPAGVGLAVLLAFLVLAVRTFETPQSTLSLPSRALRATAAVTATTLHAIRRPGWRLTVGTCAYLLCDMAVLWVAIHAIGYNAPIAPMLLAYLIGYLANAIPVPGGLGVLDGGLAGALILYHIPTPVAVGGVLLYHMLALWIPALSGTVGFVAAQRQINSGVARVQLDRTASGPTAPISMAETRGGRGARREQRSSSARTRVCRPRTSECG